MCELLEITAVKFNPTLDKDVVKTINGSYTVPKTPQLFSNDDDGDMAGDGVWSYTWNGENRLLSVEIPGKTRVEAEYDYSGRRISKKAYSWVNSAWQLDKYLKFAYNGFKLVAEYDGVTNSCLRRYCWNGDKLEWMMNGSTVYYYVIDGNKNVTALVDSTGVLDAEYEYGQFGEILSKFGPMADINPFRFSSEYFDSETGLIYYLYRYYSPDLRRWLNRDLIEEDGGVNLYGFINNNAISSFDLLGLRQTGHHIIPEAAWKEIFCDMTLWDKVLDTTEATVGQNYIDHNALAHREYSTRVKERINEYLTHNKIDPCCRVEKKDVEAILKLIKNSPDPYINGFNEAIRTGGKEGLAKWLDSGARDIAKAERKALQEAQKASGTIGGKLRYVKYGGKVVKVILIGSFIYTASTEGIEAATIETLRDMVFADEVQWGIDNGQKWLNDKYPPIPLSDKCNKCGVKSSTVEYPTPR